MVVWRPLSFDHSASFSAPSRSPASGFSQTTCFPTRRASRTSGGCRSLAVVTCTTSIAGSRSGNRSATVAVPLTGPITSTPMLLSALACAFPALPAPTTSARCATTGIVVARVRQNRGMADVAPLKALRYGDQAEPLGELLCPPYDVISPEERDRLYAQNPHNFVRIEFPKPDGDPYAAAAADLAAWRHRGVMRQDVAAAIYVHDHEFSVGKTRVRRRGVHCALRLHRPEEGIVMPHELTFPTAKEDRLALLRSTRTNSSAIFGVFEDARGEIAGGIARHIEGTKPTAEATVGGDQHRVWAIGDRLAIGEFRDALARRRVYIADGHHRYETALTYLAERGAGAPADAPTGYVLAYLCSADDPGLRIFATHRVVRGNGALDRAIDRYFQRGPIDAGAIGDIQPGIVVVRDGHYEQLTLKENADLSPVRPAWRELPVAQAEELLLRDAREAGAEIAYEHDTSAAVAATEVGATAVLLRAVDPNTLRRVADAGERLPQKTTYFYPKVPAGLVVRSLD